MSDDVERCVDCGARLDEQSLELYPGEWVCADCLGKDKTPVGPAPEMACWDEDDDIPF